MFYNPFLDLDGCIKTVKTCKYLEEATMLSLCNLLRALLLEESTIQPISTPVTIAGDIHGQFWDLLELLRRSDGEDGEVGRYIFMGDFVDRGYYSLETVSLLFLLKARYPEKVLLLRGNHESRQITKVYGFYDECQQKYGTASVWKACCNVFDYLNLAAIIDNQIFCVHGGLSPDIKTLDQIRVLARVQEVPHEGAFCDLMWSDPEEIDTWAVSPRGAGWLFGESVTHQFCHNNGLSLIARAHQLVQEGYKYMFNDALVTVWSAPNYCYRCGNLASVLRLGYGDSRSTDDKEGLQEVPLDLDGTSSDGGSRRSISSSSSDESILQKVGRKTQLPTSMWMKQRDGISEEFIVYDAAPENADDREQRAGRVGMGNLRYFV